MISQLALLAIHKAPAIKLSEVCEKYLGLSYEEALRRAAVNSLPVPTFRLGNSRKSPLMVSCEALGRYIDEQADKAQKDWLNSQL